MKHLVVVSLVALLCVSGCSVKHTSTKSTTPGAPSPAPSGNAGADSVKLSAFVIDGQGFFYVLDEFNDKLAKYDSTGKRVEGWTPKLNRPKGIAIDPAGRIFLGEESEDMKPMLRELDSSGKAVDDIALGDSSSFQPTTFAVDAKGFVYTIDGGDPISKYDSKGKLISKIGSVGTGQGQLAMVVRLALDSAGNIYASESGGSFSHTSNGKTVAGNAKARVQKFDPSGKFVAEVVKAQEDIFGMKDAAVSANGDIYVLTMNEVMKYNSAGKMVAKWPLEQNVGVFAENIVVDKQDNVYIGCGEVDSSNIYKYDASGKLTATIPIK